MCNQRQKSGCRASSNDSGGQGKCAVRHSLALGGKAGLFLLASARSTAPSTRWSPLAMLSLYRRAHSSACVSTYNPGDSASDAEYIQGAAAWHAEAPQSPALTWKQPAAILWHTQQSFCTKRTFKYPSMVPQTRQSRNCITTNRTHQPGAWGPPRA